MIGRGTRLRPDLYGPGQHKADFFVFDCCQNFEYFNQNPTTVDGSLSESLAERLFKAQLELVCRLDQRFPDDALPKVDINEVDGTQSETGLRWEVAHYLHQRVSGMNLDNFVVRRERRLVEHYSDFDQWHRLTPDVVIEIGTHLASLPTTERDDDEAAKRFDLLVLRLQLGQLNAEPGHERLRKQVQEIASALLEQTSIPAIREQQQLLDEVAGDEWWQDVTLPMLELLRRRVRLLVKLIEKSKRAVVYTDFADHLDDLVEVELLGVGTGNTFERFRAKARAYLRSHEDHLALQKLRRNKPLSPTDLTELERMLVESGGDTEDIERARRASGLGLFIRSLVGLDREAAKAAFSEFLSGKALSGNQIHFVDLIINHLTENGTMEAARLYEPPFTEIAPHGPDSLFASADVDALISILDSVRASAERAQEVA
jgi:type I restriction enzyme R subunit